MTQKRTFGNDPNQVPKNKDLGTLAYQDADNVNVQGDVTLAVARQETQISNVKPSLLLDFAKSGVLDPRVTFTRASTAAYYDGRSVAVAEQNLLTYSQQFGVSSAWGVVTVGETVVANSTIAPDGTLTGCSIFDGSANSIHGVGQVSSTTYNGTCTVSCYLKMGTIQYASVLLWDGSTYNGVVVDLLGGVITNTTGSLLSSSMTLIINGWYRVSITKTINSVPTVQIDLSNSGTPTVSAGRPMYSGTGGFVYIWGAQLEQRSSVTAYVPTTTAAITNYTPALQYAAANVPRFDYDPITGEAKGLLVEESRANLLTYASDYTNAAWTKANSTIQANIAVAPDGTLTGCKYVSNAGFTTGTSTYLVRTVVVGAGAIAMSIFAKAGEITQFVIQDGSGNGSTFSLLTGIVANFGSGSGQIVSVGNGWYRCIVGIASAAANPAFTIYPVSGTCNGFNGLYFWGAQAEVGAFATSYIPTTSGQVTRTADAPSMTGTNFTSWFNAIEGTFVAEFDRLGVGINQRVFTASDSSNASQISIINGQSSGAIDTYQVISPGMTGTTGSYGATPAANVVTRNALAYKSKNIGGSNNGSAATFYSGAATDQVAVSPTVFGIGYLASSNIQYLNGHIRRLTYYPKRLPNAELIEMTQ